MPIRAEKDGYFEIEYGEDYTGLNVQQPENQIPMTATPAVSNFFFRNKELRSRPTLTKHFRAPDDVNTVLGQFSFGDVNSVNHTICVTPRAAWQLKGDKIIPAVNPWAFLKGPQMHATNPIAYRVFANVAYWTNGAPFLPYWDGISQFATRTATVISKADSPTVVPGSTGPLTLGGVYLSELNNHLLLANVTALDDGTGVTYRFPQRLWWSANGLPLVWSPVTNTNAGFNDFLDCPDQLTGIITIGIAGFLFRTNGITQFTSTGQGLNPFQFDHLWASDHGIGNAYPWSIHSYGSMGFFASTEDIYMMSVNNFQPIGGMARDAIYADISQASGNIVASVVPTLGNGYIFMHYMIAIPLTNFTRFYIYSIADNNWTQWDAKGLIATGREEECWTGQLPAFNVPGVFPPAVSSSSGAAPGAGGGSGAPAGGGNPPPTDGGPGNPRGFIY